MTFPEPADLASTNRRHFVKAGVGLSAAGLTGLAAVRNLMADEPGATPAARLIQSGNTVVFQGDSITDTSRDRGTADKPNAFKGMGSGYAWLAAAQILVDQPEADLKFFNRGISGNKVFQLAERWQAECLDLKPDVLSILIGVNDFWHKLEGKYDGTVEKYETDYRALIKLTKKALPNVKLVICEPFVLRVGSVNDDWFPEFDAYRAAAAKIAKEFGATFIAFQTMFDRAATIAPGTEWAADGVHPTAHGAALMADWWMRAVGA